MSIIMVTQQKFHHSFFTLEVTTEVGPRFVRLIPAAPPDLFAELPTSIDNRAGVSSAGWSPPLGIAGTPAIRIARYERLQTGREGKWFCPFREDDFQDTHYSRTIEVTFDSPPRG